MTAVMVIDFSNLYFTAQNDDDVNTSRQVY